MYVQISLQSRHLAVGLEDGPEHLVLKVPSTDEAAFMDYSVRDHIFLLTDDSRSSVDSFRLKDSDLVPQGRILGLQNDTIGAIALDWVTYNVYWSSKNQPGLQVTSIPAERTAVLLNVGLKRLESLALHPPTGNLCFSNLDQPGSGTVECSSMDGSERRVVCRDVVHATSLVFSTDGGTVYWADTGQEPFEGVWRRLDHGNGIMETWCCCRSGEHQLCPFKWIWVQEGECRRCFCCGSE